MQKIAKKLIEIMKDCAYVTKNGINNFHNYKYATSADVLEKINTAMVKQGICSIAIPEIISIDEVTTAKGNTEKLATVKISITLMDKDSDENITITGLGSGQDAGDKAVMKAQTAAIKYAYMLSFAIATGDDPEADNKTDENMVVRVKPIQKKKSTVIKPVKAACVNCGVVISDKVKTYSMEKYGRPLCLDCQKGAKVVA
ncbi:ERF family protein [Pectinatus frisingensis]|uniref:ERF family protein n=1 Tax=Pectinatus frisingensis TaxID=865 RepID=UPI0018C557F1|nr:ERF family protein [Pectinatus frisingensis]